MEQKLSKHDVERWFKQWSVDSEDSLETALSLLDSKRYHHALFFCHLALEKIIKAHHVKAKNTLPLFIHDIVLLAKRADIAFSESQMLQLAEINGFNIRARYDDYKRSFYNRATKEYAN